MHELPAKDTAGYYILDPGTGLPGLVHEVQPMKDGTVFLLYGQDRPKGSLGCQLPPDKLVTVPSSFRYSNGKQVTFEQPELPDAKDPFDDDEEDPFG
jgi:hypothetical protein